MTVFEVARQVDCVQAAERLGLQLKRLGSRHFTRCLFHAENTPSMCLYPDDGGFYCFGCQKHGDVIRLYQQVLSISPLDAAKRICSDFGLSYDQRKHKKQAPPPYKPPALTAQILAKKLTDWREKQVQQFLFTKRTAEAQRIGSKHAVAMQEWTYPMRWRIPSGKRHFSRNAWRRNASPYWTACRCRNYFRK